MITLMVRSLEPNKSGSGWLVLNPVAAMSLVFSAVVVGATSSEVIVVRDDCTGRIVAHEYGQHGAARSG